MDGIKKLLGVILIEVMLTAIFVGMVIATAASPAGIF